MRLVSDWLGLRSRFYDGAGAVYPRVESYSTTQMRFARFYGDRSYHQPISDQRRCEEGGNGGPRWSVLAYHETKGGVLWQRLNGGKGFVGVVPKKAVHWSGLRW